MAITKLQFVPSPTQLSSDGPQVPMQATTMTTGMTTMRVSDNTTEYKLGMDLAIHKWIYEYYARRLKTHAWSTVAKEDKMTTEPAKRKRKQRALSIISCAESLAKTVQLPDGEYCSVVLEQMVPSIHDDSWSCWNERLQEAYRILAQAVVDHANILNPPASRSRQCTISAIGSALQPPTKPPAAATGLQAYGFSWS